MSQRLLLIDRGNSGLKWLFLAAQEAPRRGRDMAELPAIATGEDGVTPALIASVAGEQANGELVAELTGRGFAPWLACTPAALGALRNSYEQPERMGVDRWLAMLAARHRHSGRLCVVDAGSALTIDFVDSEGGHEGGFIIPGAALMRRALFQDTDRVRFDASVEAELVPGCSTAEAVNNGLLLAQAGAVRLALANAGAGGGTPRVFFCGGGAEELERAMDCAVARVPDLVFEGLVLQAAKQKVIDGSWMSCLTESGLTAPPGTPTNA